MKRSQISAAQLLQRAFSVPLSGMNKTSARFSASIASTVIWSGLPAPMPMIRMLRIMPRDPGAARQSSRHSMSSPGRERHDLLQARP
jgi:hypothetical protein